MAYTQDGMEFEWRRADSIQQGDVILEPDFDDKRGPFEVSTVKDHGLNVDIVGFQDGHTCHIRARRRDEVRVKVITRHVARRRGHV